MYMTDTVGTAELRQNLSKYLQRVRNGERLVVTERNRPVATLGPVDATPGLTRLIADGLVTPAEKPLRLPRRIKLPGDRPGTEALEEVRDDR